MPLTFQSAQELWQPFSVGYRLCRHHK